MSRWLAPALLGGGGAIVLCTSENWRAIRMSLREHGLNPRDLEGSDRIVVLDVYEFLAQFMRDGRPRSHHFLATLGRAAERVRTATGDGEVRAWGEAVDVLRQNRNLLAAQFLEALWNEGIREHGLRLLCSYHVDTLDIATHKERLRDLADRHGTLIPVSDYRALNDAVERALIDLYGADAASTMLADFWNREGAIRMPVGQRVLMFFQENRPKAAPRLFARTRLHYEPQVISMSRPHGIMVTA